MTPEDLLKSVRLRLRRTRALQHVLDHSWIPAGIALVLVIAARFVRFNLEPLAVLAMICGTAGLAAFGWLKRTSIPQVAIIADRELGSHDALSAYLEFGYPGAWSDRFSDRIWERAHRIADIAESKSATPSLGIHRKRLAAGALLPMMVLGLIFAPNPQDTARDHAAAVELAKGEAADRLREAAKALDPESGAAEELEQLAKRIDNASPAQAMELIRAAEAELMDVAGVGLESARAATEGLDASLKDKPLPGAENGKAADQLDVVADSLGEMSGAERSELAQRLRSLAGTQAVGSPEVGSALSAAADAIDAGSVDAPALLKATADAQREQSASVQQRKAADSAAAAAAMARNDLGAALDGNPNSAAERARAAAQAAAPAQGKGSGQGQGQGQGSGQGQGQGQGSGQGQGQGSGQGQGQGQGSGQGQGKGAGGAPSGNVTGGDRNGGGSGQGGQGRPGTGGAGSAGSGTEGESIESGGSVFAPDPRASASGEGPASTTGGDLGEVTGKGNAANEVGSVRTSLTEAIRRYSDGATRVAGQPGIPSSHRQLINDYFARLSGAS